MRITFHNARVGSGKHNDRSFNLDKTSHIDETRTNKNLYINALNDKSLSFQESEIKFYQYYFKDFIDDKNARALTSRHPERCVTAEDLLKSDRYRPEEVIFQIGDKNSHISEKQLTEVFGRFLQWHQEKFKNHIETLNIAFHFDEKTPHVHWRKVYMYDDDKGFKSIGQNKALKQCGYQLPDENQQRSRSNNLKIQYTKECREKLFEICRELEIYVDEKPLKRAPNQQNLLKGDFIIQQQDEEIQRQKIEYTELEKKQTTLQQNIHSIEDVLNQQQNEYNRLMQENQRLSVENNVNEEKLKQYRDKLLQVAFYEKNKSKIEVINKSFTEKIEMKTFFNSDKVKIEKSELIPLLALSQEIEERIKNLEEREKQLNLKENSINKQAESIVNDANLKASTIIEKAEKTASSLENQVKIAKLESKIQRYERIIPENELIQREKQRERRNINERER